MSAVSGKSSTASKIQIDAAQSNFKSVLSECEDVSSIFVGKSAGDLDRALYCAMLAFRNSGQGIVPSAFPLIAPATPKRLVIHQDVCDEFLQRLVGERVQQSRWKLGHALDPSIDQGPMLNAQLQQKILDEIVFATTHKSKSRGMIADLVFGGFAPKFPGGGKFVAPWWWFLSGLTCTFVADIGFAMFTPEYETMQAYYKPALDSLWIVGYLAMAYGLGRFGWLIQSARQSIVESSKRKPR